MYKKKSLFVTFEGIEGSGKSYLSKKLFFSLKRRKIPVIHTREPGGTLISEKIRNILLNKENIINPTEEILLLMASRLNHINTVIKPA